MKQTRFILCCALTALLCISQNSKAQTPVAASNFDSPITFGGTTDARNVNCDMIYNINAGNSGQLRAVAYDDYAATNSYVYLEDYSGGATTITIPGATDIDVVLGDDMSNPGVDYLAVVVYIMSGTPYIETYSIVGTGTGGLTASSVNIATLPAGGNCFMPPHVDLFPDPSTLINGLPALYQYAATWSERVGSNFDIYLTHGDISAPGTFINTYTVTTNGLGYWPDVACLWDVSTNEAYAYVPYMNSNTVDLFEVNLTTTATSTTATISTVWVEKSIRIEAMNLYDPANGLQKYEIAYAGAVGGVLEIFSYNDLTGNTVLSVALGGGNNIHPAVSAGPGPLVTSGYGNENHSVCWYADATPYYYSMAIDITTGLVSGGYPDYYECNLNPTPFIVLDAYYAPIGVSSSSNLGDNELLTAWNNNNDIYYKYQGDIAQYKTTGISKLNAVTHKLYPNPAADKIYVGGVATAQYVVTGITGCKALQGTISKQNNTINISGLTEGIYLVNITENGKTSILKFIKQ